jgi:putative spermidine/putrescine transport system substrate-binding protein
MPGKLSRREVLQHTAAAAAAIAATEMGMLRAAHAEPTFTVASAGGSWAEGVRDAYVVAPKLEEKFNLKAAYAHQLESISASKMMADPDNPPFSVTTHGDPEAILLADRGVLQGYDLDKVPNYKDIYETATLPPRAGMQSWFASHVMLLWALTYNTKHASKPVSFQDMWSDKYKGRVGVPAYGWYGMMWLHEVNKTLGGNEGDVSKGLAAIADLVKKNKAVILENADHTLKAFEREEVVIAPFFNGRTSQMQEQKLPVDIAYVPGSVALGTGFVIAKATKFKEASNAFINATCTPEYQLMMTKKFRYPPSNKKAVLPAEMAHYAVTEKALENTVRLDWAKMNEGRAANLERWNKEVLGS